MTYIDNDDGDRDSYYEDGNVEVRSPILYDNTSRSKIIWQNDGILEKVIPSSCISNI